MNLEVSKIPKSEFKLIPVASELVPTGIKTISHNDEKWDIIDRYTFHKKSFFPTGFMHFVFGEEIEERLIWEKYKKSDSLIIFICKPIEKENKEVPNLFEKG